jgi:hypothetical protein
VWIAELTINLLARLYPKIAICSDVHGDKLQAIARSINPDIEVLPSGPTANVISIGTTPVKDGLFPFASGWVAHLRSKPRRPTKPLDNPYAAGAAATLACSELFRRVFLARKDVRSISISLLNFDATTGKDLKLAAHNIGEVLYAGVGAVGNAGLWAMGRHSSLHGTLTIVDPETLTLSNLQRYALGTHTDLSRLKVDLAKEALTETALQVATTPCALAEYVDQRPGTPHTICVSVDNVAGRRTAQALLPKLVVNGWTGDQALGASWHRFSDPVACLACLYHPRRPGPSATEQAAKALGISNERASLLWITRQPMTDDDISAAATALGADLSALQSWRGKPLGDLYTDVVCGAAPINMVGAAGRVETVPLAHQSALAGILMAAELVKRTDKQLSALSQKEPLVSWDNILQGMPLLWAKPRAREPGCICGDEDYQKSYRKKWRIKS